MLTVKFIAACNEDGFDPKDIAILANQPTTDWQELTPEQSSAGLFPVYAEAENTHVFGFLPGHIVDEYPELLTDLATELKMYAEDWDYELAVDPAIGIKVMIYGGFLED